MPTSVFVNEFHYDNAGTDAGEFIEIAGPAGTSLAGWSVVFYNGSNAPTAAVPYRTLALSGVIDDEGGSGFGALSFALPVDGLQNGANDGFALVNAANEVVQFLSYEGVITAAAGAAGGPAAGLTSTDVGVGESNGTPAGFSLRLAGAGTTYEGFTWQAPADDTPGEVNQGQTFGAAPQPGRLSIADASVVEGDAGETDLVFTVSRTGGTAGAVSATYTIGFPAGGADAGDLAAGQPLTGIVSFADGVDEATVTVRVAGDTAVEADEAFTVTLSAPEGGATLDDAAATGTITNDDSAAAGGTAFINELLYDPAGADSNEAVEIAGTAGLDLTGWKLVLYNGNGGGDYQTINLSGTIDDEDNGFGALSFPTPGIQNGAPDGLALVNASNNVVQFLSYEGVFAATSGPAQGLTSEDIGVAQTGSEPNTHSLQLKGAGSEEGDFTWTAASASSFGSINAGQDFAAPNPNGSFRVGDANVMEGNGGTSTIEFTVRRAGGTDGTATVGYSVAFGSGSGRADAADLSGPTGGTLTFADGEDERTIAIQVVGDTASEPDETFTVQLADATGGADIADATATGTIVSDDIATLRIHEIQGAGHRSAYEGQAVVTSGVVTQVVGNGFYIQEPNPDASRATSEGIFVFTRTAPGAAATVGNLVRVTGEVGEFRPGADPLNLTVTQIAPSAALEVVSTGNALPGAALIGPDGLAPPTTIIEDDGFSSFNPATDGVDFYESLEGMRVTVQDPVVIQPTNGFGEIWTLASRDGADLLGTNLSADGLPVVRGGEGGLGVVNQLAGSDFNPERIQIDGLSGDLADVATGTVLADVTGILSYSFGNYEVLTASVTVAKTAAPTQETTALAGADDALLLASYNVLNLDPNDGDGDADVASGRFDAIAFDIATNLNLPDVIVLQEVQDDDGSVNSDVVSANGTLSLLSDRIFAASGIRYSFQDNPFITDDRSGGEPGGNIRVAFLYRQDRVDLDEASVATLVDPAAQANDPANPFYAARPPLVGDFLFNGERVTVVGNHFTSKGGSSPLYGSVQPSVAGGEVRRAQQADVVNDYVEARLAADAGARIVVAGDLNEFQFEEPLGVLTGVLELDGATLSSGGAAELRNLTELLPENERYSYVFEGNAQQLDHVLVTNALSSGAAVDVVHINRDGFAADHDPVVARLVIPAANPGCPVLDREGTVDGSAAANEVLTGFAAANTFFFDVEAASGRDRITNFGRNDVLATSRALFDGNRDGVVTFGRDNRLGLDGQNGGDTVALPGVGSLRFLGEACDGVFVYADARVRPSGAFEGTLGDDVLAGAANGARVEDFFYDTALGIDLGDDRIERFDANDRLVTTVALFDEDGDGVIEFGTDGRFDLSDGSGDLGSVAIFGAAGEQVRTLRFDGTVAANGVTYHRYSLVDDPTFGG
ncbi:Calx-beta domain-containing protein [Sphingomonas lenta]|uniref:Calx-beta domain-containing protein n=1 Tax=Sphingomonas lenta TaxID=1141887 RepID=A0A2A2SAJ5_9SPHN|nr:Calx-beta domain-containing protein [Sphingomonas lenta]PAX06324.1 hypothetical protein CKY28_17715 [Sphingomonas lenta]